MIEKKDGGAAFHNEYTDGMSLRDYFAAKAMQGMIASGKILMIDNMRTDNEGYSKMAYSIADTMLKEREE